MVRVQGLLRVGLGWLVGQKNVDAFTQEVEDGF